MKQKKSKQIKGLDPVIMNIDLTNVKKKLMLPESEEGTGWSKDKVRLAEKEYMRFLTLLKRYPDEKFVPNKLMDEMWHRHILDTAAYRADCKRVFDVFIDHFPYYGLNGKEDKLNLQNDFEKTKRLYNKEFGEEMDRESLATRCEGHPCHAVTSCACRVSTACKN